MSYEDIISIAKYNIIFIIIFTPILLFISNYCYKNHIKYFDNILDNYILPIYSISGFFVFMLSVFTWLGCEVRQHKEMQIKQEQIKLQEKLESFNEFIKNSNTVKILSMDICRTGTSYPYYKVCIENSYHKRKYINIDLPIEDPVVVGDFWKAEVNDEKIVLTQRIEKE